MALGTSRARVIRQLLTERVVLASIARSTASPRFYLLLGSFPAAALALAAAGIYGVMSYAVRGGAARSESEWRWGRAAETCCAW